MLQKEGLYSKTCEENTVLLETFPRQPDYFPNVNVPLEKIHHHMQRSFQSQNHDQSMKSIPSQCPLRRSLTSLNYATRTEYNDPRPYRSCYSSMSPLRSHNHEQGMKSPWTNQFQRQGLDIKRALTSVQKRVQTQLCRFHAQGRCYYGDQCKYLHDYREYRNYGPAKDERWETGLSDLRY